MLLILFEIVQTFRMHVCRIWFIHLLFCRFMGIPFFGVVLFWCMQFFDKHINNNEDWSYLIFSMVPVNRLNEKHAHHPPPQSLQCTLHYSTFLILLHVCREWPLSLLNDGENRTKKVASNLFSQKQTSTKTKTTKQTTIINNQNKNYNNDQQKAIQYDPPSYHFHSRTIRCHLR